MYCQATINITVYIMSNKLSSKFSSSLVFLSIILLATSAFADRKSSLAGNILIEDSDDVFFFPQTALKHRNLVNFDLAVSTGAQTTPNDESGSINVGENTMRGSGLLLFGEEGFAFGISTHRQDTFGSAPQGFLGVGDLQLYNATSLGAWGINGPSNPTPGGIVDPNMISQGAGAAGAAFLQPLQMADVILAFGLGEQNSLGLRLSVGQANASGRLLGANDSDITNSWNTTAINLSAGFSHKSDIQFDLGLELGLAFFSNSFTTTAQTPDYNDSASLAPSLSLYGRTMIPLRDSVKLGALAIVHLNSSSMTDETGVEPGTNTDPLDFSTTSFNLFIETGAGPVYELPDSTVISAYATLGFGVSSFAFESDDIDVSSTTLVLPGFRLALEHTIVEWLTFRSGLSSRYNFNFQTKNFDDIGTPNEQTSGSSYEFLWSAGVGLNFGNFTFDGTFQAPFLTDGPSFLGGKDNGVFGLVAVGYKF